MPSPARQRFGSRRLEALQLCLDGLSAAELLQARRLVTSQYLNSLGHKASSTAKSVNGHMESAFKALAAMDVASAGATPGAARLHAAECSRCLLLAHGAVQKVPPPAAVAAAPAPEYYRPTEVRSQPHRTRVRPASPTYRSGVRPASSAPSRRVGAANRLAGAASTSSLGATSPTRAGSPALLSPADQLRVARLTSSRPRSAPGGGPQRHDDEAEEPQRHRPEFGSLAGPGFFGGDEAVNLVLQRHKSVTSAYTAQLAPWTANGGTSAVSYS